MQEKAKKQKRQTPHTLVIIMIIILLAVSLTWVITPGMYDRVEDPDTGKKVVVPESYHKVERSGVNLLDVPKYIMESFETRGELIFFILMAGAAFNVITESGAIHSSIAKIAKKYSKSRSLFVAIIMLLFALICTTQGVNTFIAFAPITVLIALSLGLDSIVGVGIILLGGAVGFSTGTLQPSTTLTAQGILGLPSFSGIGMRWISFAVFYIVTTAYMIHYSKKIAKDPTKSPMYELDKLRNSSKIDLDSFGEMTIRKVGVLLALVGALVWMVYGGINLGYKFTENGAIFIFLAITAGLIAGFRPSKIATCVTNGAKTMIGAALILGAATAVSKILADGQVLDPIVHGITRVLSVTPKILLGPVMFLSNIVINGAITSGSGQAAVVMPIFGPVSDMIGISKQLTILAFNFGDGFCNYVLPTSTALMGILSVGDVPYDRWIKFMWKLFLIWLAVGSLLLIFAQVTGY